MANKYLDTYKKRKRKKKAKKIKRKLAKAGYAGVYHPPKKGADPKSIRDIGHMKYEIFDVEINKITSEGGRLPATKKYKEMLKRKKVKRMKLKSK